MNTSEQVPKEEASRPRYFIHSTVCIPYLLLSIGFATFGGRLARLLWYSDAPSTSTDHYRHRAVTTAVVAIVALFCFFIRGMVSLVIMITNSDPILVAFETSMWSNLALNALPALTILVALHVRAMHDISRLEHGAIRYTTYGSTDDHVPLTTIEHVYQPKDATTPMSPKQIATIRTIDESVS